MYGKSSIPESYDYTHIPNAYIPGSGIANYKDKSLQECKDICDFDSECLAFEFYADHGGTIESGWEAGSCAP
jgi:hypothetical protein